MTSKFSDFATDVLSRYSLSTNFWSIQGKILAKLKQENKELLNEKIFSNKKDDKTQENSEIDDYLPKLDSEIKFRRKNDKKEFVGNLDLKLKFLIEHSFRCLKEIRNKIPKEIIKRNFNALKQLEEKLNSVELLDTSEKIDLLEKCEILKLCLLRELNHPWKVITNLKEALIESSWNLVEISSQIENLENSEVAKVINEKSEVLATNNMEKLSEFLAKIEKLKSEALKIGEISRINDDRVLTDLRRTIEKTQDSLCSLIGSDDEEFNKLSSKLLKLNENSEEILSFQEAQIDQLVLVAKKFKNSTETVEITKAKFLSKIQQHLLNSTQSIQSLSSITYHDSNLSIMEKEISRGNFKSLFKIGKLQENMRRDMINSLPEYSIDMKSLSNLLKMLKNTHRSMLEMSNRLKIKNEELLAKIEELNEGYELATLRYQEIASAEKKYKLIYMQSFQKALGESWEKHLEIIDALIRYIPYMNNSIGDLLSFGGLVKESESTLRMLMELFAPNNKTLFRKLEQLLNKKVEIDTNLFKINEADMLSSQWKTIENYFTSSRDLILEEETLKQELIKFSEFSKEKFELKELIKTTYDESLELSKKVLEETGRIEKKLEEYMDFRSSYTVSYASRDSQEHKANNYPKSNKNDPSFLYTSISESLRNLHELQSKLLDNFESQNKIAESVALAGLNLQESSFQTLDPKLFSNPRLTENANLQHFFIKGSSIEPLSKLISLIQSSQSFKAQENRALIARREPLIAQVINIIWMFIETIQCELLDTFESKINFIKDEEIKENVSIIIEFLKQIRISTEKEPLVKLLNNIFQWKEEIHRKFIILISKLFDANLEIREEIIVEEIQTQVKIPNQKKGQKVRSRKKPEKEDKESEMPVQSECKIIEKSSNYLISDIEERANNLLRDCGAILEIINPRYTKENLYESSSNKGDQTEIILDSLKSSAYILEEIKKISKDLIYANSSAKKSIDELKSQLTKLEIFEKINAELIESQQELKDKDSSIKSLKATISTLEKENKNWIEMYTSLNKIIDEREEEWIREKSKFEESNASQNETIINLDKEIENLNKKIEKQSEEMLWLEGEKCKLNTELARLENLRNKDEFPENEEITLNQEEVIRITDSISILDNEIVTLEDEIENRNSLIQEQHEIIENHKSERISFDEAIFAQNDTITQLNEEIYNLKEVIQKQEEIISIHEEENNELKAIIQKKDEESSIMNASLSKLNEEFNQSKIECCAYENSVKDLELKLQIATTNLRLESIEVRRLKDDISSMKIKIDSDENLQPILQIKEEQIEDLNIQLISLQDSQKLLDEVKSELWARNKELEIENENLNREKNDLEYQVRIFKINQNEASSDQKYRFESKSYSDERTGANQSLIEKSVIIGNLEVQVSNLLLKEKDSKISIRNLLLRILHIRTLNHLKFVCARRFNKWQGYVIALDTTSGQFNPEVPVLTLAAPEESVIQIPRYHRELNIINTNEIITAEIIGSQEENLIDEERSQPDNTNI